MPENNLAQEIKNLLYDGNYDISQQIGDGDEEMYEGCEDNLISVLDSGEATLQLLPTTSPHARPDTITYSIAYQTYIGPITIYIWEI